MNIQSDFDFLIKLALLGDPTVGKTNLVIRYTENTFSLNTPPTIGYDYKSKTVDIKKTKQKAKVQIFDTAGQERYMSLSKNVYKRVDGVILVYDITQMQTFKNISKWIELIKEFNDNLPILLIGNKIDSDERIVSFEEGKKFGDENKINFFETSALSGANVEEAFESFINEIVKFLKNKNPVSSDTFSLSKEKKKSQKKKCCKK